MEKRVINLYKVKQGSLMEVSDEVAIEYLLNVQIDGEKSFSVSCTPSNLEELVLGQLYSREMIQCREQVEKLELNLEDHLADVWLKKENLSDIRNDYEHKSKNIMEIKMSGVFEIADGLYHKTGSLFVETGCAHSCALIKDGQVLCQLEDIGRHNALDKVIGYALKNSIILSECVVFSSGRISGDYLQKVLCAGVRVVVSRAAVTSEAIKLAKENDITMFGFVRKNTGNLYNKSEDVLVIM